LIKNFDKIGVFPTSFECFGLVVALVISYFVVGSSVFSSLLQVMQVMQPEEEYKE
jgi:hypothetical protein